MKITSFTTFRQKLSSYMDLVTKSQSPLYVTRQGKEDLVLLSKAEYEGMKETFYLMSSPENAKRLNESVNEYKAGGGQIRKLID